MRVSADTLMQTVTRESLSDRAHSENIRKTFLSITSLFVGQFVCRSVCLSIGGVQAGVGQNVTFLATYGKYGTLLRNDENIEYIDSIVATAIYIQYIFNICHIWRAPKAEKVV